MTDRSGSVGHEVITVEINTSPSLTQLNAWKQLWRCLLAPVSMKAKKERPGGRPGR